MITLEQYITQHLTTPFKWGSNDCVTFAIGWLSIASGVDWIRKYGEWDNKRQAYSVIDKVGGFETELDKHLVRIAPTMAKDGDLCVVNNCMMLFYGSRIVGMGKSGLVYLDRGLASCSWRSF